MKLVFKQIEPFVAAPDPAARVILVYGPDQGLMKERSTRMAKTCRNLAPGKNSGGSRHFL